MVRFLDLAFRYKKRGKGSSRTQQNRRHHRTIIATAIAADEVQIKTPTPPKSIMTRLALLFGTVVLAGGAVAAFTVSSNGGVAAPTASTSTSTVSRRDFVAKSAAAGAAVALPKAAVADDAAADPYADYVTSESGMRYLITKEGDGAVPSAGQLVKAHYTGWLDGFESSKKFDSSRDRGRPFQFKVGAGQVIRGWDEAFSSMKVGERRKIILPSKLAYGDRGAGGIIPGGATLYFDVELLAIL
ncbi:hypothetical protein ACHAW5_009925 [Stephanodiscus triporus]|uniref:peptidylprolyl isomerase n=1 Tax=Stephanodiscus triporus TaxID=2934178 RepID=A0ABD3NA30_9STRA